MTQADRDRNENDAVTVHDLVEDINTLQAETGRDTTITDD